MKGFFISTGACNYKHFLIIETKREIIEVKTTLFVPIFKFCQSRKKTYHPRPDSGCIDFFIDLKKNQI